MCYNLYKTIYAREVNRMIPNFTIEESMGESTQIIYSKCESAYDDYLEGFDDLLDNTEYAFKVECEMKKSVKNGIISKLKEKNMEFDHSDNDSIWKVLSKLYKLHGIAPETVRKVVKDNWIKEGKWNTDRDNREKMYILCMVLDLGLEETKRFFSNCFFTLPFNFKDKIDAVYYYCIKNNKEYSETQKILKIVSEQNDVLCENMSTIEVEHQITNINNDEELIDFTRKLCYSRNLQMLSAKTMIKELWKECYECSKKIQRYCNIKSPNKSISRSKLLSEIYGLNFQKTQKKSGGKGISKGDLPKSFYESIPKDGEINKILKGEDVSYEILRKAVIIFSFYCFYSNIIIQEGNNQNEKNIENVKRDLYDFYSETNDRLTKIGYNVMYVKHPFEWVIFYCAYTPDPVETFHELLSQRYWNCQEMCSRRKPKI